MKTRAAVAWAAGKPLEVLTVDLDGPRLPWFWIKFQIRKARAGNDEGVAGFKDLLRRGRAKQADPAGGQRMIVRHHRFAEERLHDGCAEQLSQLKYFGFGA